MIGLSGRRYTAPREYLPWTFDNIYVPGKIIAGVRAIEHMERNGWPAGYFSEASCLRLEEEASDIVVGLVDDFRARYKGEHSFGYMLAHRGCHCLPHGYSKGRDELKPLKRDGLRPFFDMVVRHMSEQRPIRREDILRAEEEVVLLQAFDKIGVYFRELPWIGNVCYIGKAADETIDERNDGHLGSVLSMTKAWLFNTTSEVGIFEGLLHSGLQQRFGAKPWRFGRRTKGLWELPHGTDARKAVEEIVRGIPRFYYGTASFQDALR
jgi:hypothetical protein